MKSEFVLEKVRTSGILGQDEVLIAICPSNLGRLGFHPERLSLGVIFATAPIGVSVAVAQTSGWQKVAPIAILASGVGAAIGTSLDSLRAARRKGRARPRATDDLPGPVVLALTNHRIVVFSSVTKPNVWAEIPIHDVTRVSTQTKKRFGLVVSGTTEFEAKTLETPLAFRFAPDQASRGTEFFQRVDEMIATPRY